MGRDGVEAYFGEAYEAGRRGFRMNRSLDELPYDRFPDQKDRDTMVRAWNYEMDKLSGNSPVAAPPADADVDEEPSGPRL